MAVGGPVLVEGALRLTDALDLRQASVGLTIVALGTSAETAANTNPITTKSMASSAALAFDTLQRGRLSALCMRCLRLPNQETSQDAL